MSGVPPGQQVLPPRPLGQNPHCGWSAAFQGQGRGGGGGATVPSPGLPEQEPPSPQGHAVGTHGGGGVAPRRAAGTFLGPHPGPGPGTPRGKARPLAPSSRCLQPGVSYVNRGGPAPPRPPPRLLPTPPTLLLTYIYSKSPLWAVTQPTQPRLQGRVPPGAGGGTGHTSRALCWPTRAPHPQTRGRR